MIITIDGPSGTGKSTVAKLLAGKTGFVFFDTGAMYRAVTYTLLKQDIPFDDKARIEEVLQNFSFRIETHSNEKKYFVGNEEVTLEIRSQYITKHVSEVAALLVVRHALVELQRRFAKDVNAVFEGRDIGSVVFPEADLKVFLTARLDIRADRRFREFVFKHPSEAENMTKQQVLEDLQRRDLHDSTREHSPLKAASDAVVIDTSDSTVEEVVQKIFQIYLDKLHT
ncbi:MAG: (d)CMP kinase [Chlamydiales bacterium]|nr:(d)CMP kinase [Chlamydiales bacterium]